jgi:molybdopterin-guanine dinucleotide biosynthesis protein B
MTNVPAPENAMKVIGLAGWSGAGKTTLLTRAIPHLLKQGLRVSVIKHAHHAFDVDVPGKDSWKHREAGAAEGAGVLQPSAGP